MPDFAAARPLILARFEAARAAATGQAWATWPWTDENSTPFFSSQQTGPWLLLEIVPAGSAMSQFGSAGKRMVQDDGVIAIHAFIPTGTQPQYAWDAVAAIGNIFRMVKFQGVACEVPTPGQGAPADADGRWFRVTTSIAFATHYTA